MSFSVNQNEYQQSMGLNRAQIADNTQKISQNIQNSNNIIVNGADEHKDNPTLLTAVTVPVWLAISKAMERFNKSCATTIVNGKETSLLHKVQDFSEKIGTKFDSSKIGKKINKGSNKFSNFFKNKIIAKNQILDAVVNSPSLPKSGMAKMMSRGTIAETAQDAVEAIQRYCANTNSTIEKLGIKGKQFDKICSNPYQYLDDIKAILKKLPEEPIEVCKSQGTIAKKILSRKVYPSELMNKINALSGKSLRADGKTLSKAGKFIPKSFLRTMEGLTNGTAGGKIAIALQAYAVADAIIRAAKAPKGEKIKTFTESMTYDLSYYLMMPVGMGLMYHAGGAKYTGMTSKQVERYRKGIKLLNEKVAAGKCSKAQYKRVKALLKKQLAGDTRISVKNDGVIKSIGKSITNIVKKPVKTAGKILSTGLEQISPYIAKGENAGLGEKFIKNLPNKLKGFSGGALRFCLFMFAIAPPLAKATTKISHLIFGKPTKSVLDDEEPQISKEQIVQTITPQQPNTKFAKQYYSDKQNLLDIYKETVQNEEKTQTLENVEVQTKEENKSEQIKQLQQPNVLRTASYIPSTEGVKIAQEQPSQAVINALQNSVRAEKGANRFLRKK